MWPFKRKAETRSSGSGYTADIMAARASYIAGASGLGELTATVQACVSLWEAAFAAATVSGTDMLDRRNMTLLARSVALRGEAVFLIRENGLAACGDWDVSTRDGIPRAYRVSLSEAGGARSETVLAAEVLHLRIGSDMVAPWTGTPPLRRSSLTAGLLHTLEAALSEVYATAPLGSQIVPFPESTETEKEQIGRAFRGTRGRVILRDSVSVSAAGGPAPAQDWSPNPLSPDMQKTMALQTLEAARDAICMAFGVLPSLVNSAATGPAIREGQRHLATWVLQPIAALLAEEATVKLGGLVDIDLIMPLQAFDVGGRARAFSTFVEAIAKAKDAGLSASETDAALKWVTLAENDGRA